MKMVLARCDAAPSMAGGGERRASVSFCSSIVRRRGRRAEWGSLTVAAATWPAVAFQYRRLRRLGLERWDARQVVAGLLGAAPQVRYEPPTGGVS